MKVEYAQSTICLPIFIKTKTNALPAARETCQSS